MAPGTVAPTLMLNFLTMGEICLSFSVLHSWTNLSMFPFVASMHLVVTSRPSRRSPIWLRMSEFCFVASFSSSLTRSTLSWRWINSVFSYWCFSLAPLLICLSWFRVVWCDRCRSLRSFLCARSISLSWYMCLELSVTVSWIVFREFLKNCGGIILAVFFGSRLKPSSASNAS